MLSYTTRNLHNLPIFKSKHNFFKTSFFPSAISEWNKLDPNLSNSESFLTFKKNILQFIQFIILQSLCSHEWLKPRRSRIISLIPLGLWQLHTEFANSVYNCHNLKGIKLITRLHLGLSHLREHKFKHNFQESLNPLCNCGHGIESTTHFFLHCPLFTNERYTLLSTLSSIDCTLLNNTDFVLTQTLLFGNLSFNSNKNLEILNATIGYILSTKRFDEALF